MLHFRVGLQYILDRERRERENASEIVELPKLNGTERSVLSDEQDNTGYEVPAIPNGVREETWGIPGIAQV